MDRIEINTSKALDTSQKYMLIINELDVMTKDLLKCVNDISKDWTGEASDAFSMYHFPKLYAQMQKQINMLKFIKDEIYFAADDFNKLDVELKAKL